MSLERSPVHVCVESHWHDHAWWLTFALPSGGGYAPCICALIVGVTSHGILANRVRCYGARACHVVPTCRRAVHLSVRAIGRFPIAGFAGICTHALYRYVRSHRSSCGACAILLLWRGVTFVCIAWGEWLRTACDCHRTRQSLSNDAIARPLCAATPNNTRRLRCVKYGLVGVALVWLSPAVTSMHSRWYADLRVRHAIGMQCVDPQLQLCRHIRRMPFYCAP